MLRKFELRNYKNFKDNMVIDFGKVGAANLERIVLLIIQFVK